MNFIVHPDDIKMSELSITTKCFNEAILVVSHDLEPVEVGEIELFSRIQLTKMALTLWYLMILNRFWLDASSAVAFKIGKSYWAGKWLV